MQTWLAIQLVSALGSPLLATGETAGASYYPIFVLGLGIIAVLGLIIGMRMNAFLALTLSAVMVSLLVVGPDGFQMSQAGARMQAVVSAFGDAAGRIGIVIAMAAIIGKCMLDSGAADRVVRTAVAITGIPKASIGLMGSGFVLAVPVFFDTVFYLLVPLARSLHQRTGQNYLRYLLAIATGGVVTHTLVPPTPGPLLVGENLGVDIGTMMWTGILIAIPSAIIGLVVAVFMDRWMPLPMRPLGPSDTQSTPLDENQLPPLWLALLPIVLPVVLIGAGTLTTTLADNEDKGLLTTADLVDPEAFRSQLRQAVESEQPSAGKQWVNLDLFQAEDRQLMTDQGTLSEPQVQQLIETINRGLNSRHFYDQTAFSAVPLSAAARSGLEADPERLKPVLRRRLNRALLEDAFPQQIQPHQWDTPRRQWAERLSLWSDPNFALLLAGLVAIATLKHVRGYSLKKLSEQIETALMSGGMIILITSAGGAFGAMLKAADVGDTVEQMFADSRSGGVGLIFLAFAVSAILKIAQGSSTVAMIVASGMIAGIISGQTLPFHPVYLGTAIGSGSLLGSWMNDSGFWVFAKMGGLTEGEALRSWTVLLSVLAISGLLFTLLLSQLLPMAG